LGSRCGEFFCLETAQRHDGKDPNAALIGTFQTHNPINRQRSNTQVGSPNKTEKTGRGQRQKNNPRNRQEIKKNKRNQGDPLGNAV